MNAKSDFYKSPLLRHSWRKPESRIAWIPPSAGLDSGSRFALNTMRCRASLARNDGLPLLSRVFKASL